MRERWGILEPVTIARKGVGKSDNPFVKLERWVVPRLRKDGHVILWLPKELMIEVGENGSLEVWRFRYGGFSEYLRVTVDYPNQANNCVTIKLFGKISTKLYKGMMLEDLRLKYFEGAQ